MASGRLVAAEAGMAPPHVRLRVERHMLAPLRRQADLQHCNSNTFQRDDISWLQAIAERNPQWYKATVYKEANGRDLAACVEHVQQHTAM